MYNEQKIAPETVPVWTWPRFRMAAYQPRRTRTRRYHSTCRLSATRNAFMSLKPSASIAGPTSKAMWLRPVERMSAAKSGALSGGRIEGGTYKAVGIKPFHEGSHHEGFRSGDPLPLPSVAPCHRPGLISRQGYRWKIIIVIAGQPNSEELAGSNGSAQSTQSFKGGGARQISTPSTPPPNGSCREPSFKAFHPLPHYHPS